VLTLGRAADERFVLAGPEVLAARAIEVVRTERGGEVTYHGPGQLVAYPILDLRAFGGDVRRYVRLLEETAVRMLAAYGLCALRQPGTPGIWAGGRKIASIGVYVRRWVTMHGIAINLEPDLEDFAIIHPCGLVGVRMTSVAELLGTEGWMKAAWSDYPRAFADVLGVSLEPTTLPPAVEASGAQPRRAGRRDPA
jgi:lipoate-protein ligase B